MKESVSFREREEKSEKFFKVFLISDRICVINISQFEIFCKYEQY